MRKLFARRGPPAAGTVATGLVVLVAVAAAGIMLRIVLVEFLQVL